MNKNQKEVEKQLLDNEKEILNKLKNNYAKALKDVKQRLKDLQSNELTQSKIYQIQYQQNLKKQIQSIIDLLSSDNIKSITDYLNLMYQDGFVGTQYNMYKEGVPFIMPIDQELVLRSITKKTEDFQLSQALYQNAEALKSTIIAEVTRGISQSVAYNTIAKKLAMHSEADLKKAYRIARTEGGRVQTEAKFEAMTRAKNNGADVVKQWDSTLDSRTRLSHAKLDGQVRELEEKFEVDGHTAMYPHGFGIAEEDINCRCALLERARWAVEYENKNGFTKNVDGDIVEFKNLKDYQDFKTKYFNFYENYDKIPNEFTEAKTTLEALKRIEDALGCRTRIAGFSLDALNEELRAIEDFTRDYPEIKGYIKNFWRETNEDAGGSFGLYNSKGDVISILKMQNLSLGKWDELIKLNIQQGMFFEGDSLYTLQIHELAHALDNYAYNVLRKNWKDGRSKDTIIEGGTKTADNFTGMISSELIRRAKEEIFGTTVYEQIKDKIAYLGSYAQTSDAEMFAQCMAFEYSGQTSEFSARVKELFDDKLKQIKKLEELEL